jgi:hypothetical protein
MVAGLRTQKKKIGLCGPGADIQIKNSKSDMGFGQLFEVGRCALIFTPVY